MKKIYWILLLLFLTACSSKLVIPSSFDLPKMQVKIPSMTIEKANKGHDLYVHRCSSCHHLHDPGKFTDNQWTSILAKMLPKAKVTALTDQQLITDYLKSLSK